MQRVDGAGRPAEPGTGLSQANLSIQSRQDNVKGEIAKGICRLICMTLMYVITWTISAEENTSQSERHNLTMQLILFQLQIIFMQAAFCIALAIIMISTDEGTKTRDILMFGFIFVAVPVIFFWFYIRNFGLVQEIFTPSKLPEAKSSSTVLTLVYYIFVFLTLWNFLFINIMALVMIVGLCSFARAAYNDFMKPSAEDERKQTH